MKARAVQMTDDVDSRTFRCSLGTAGGFDKARFVAKRFQLVGDEIRTVFVVLARRVDRRNADEFTEPLDHLVRDFIDAGQHLMLKRTETHAASPERIAFSTASL